jgi:decaprenylphospho-beta-D-ribofuranose 2-oxidase
MNTLRMQTISGWGRYPVIAAHGRACDGQAKLSAFVRGDGRLIAHGLGRSYGDSALNERVAFTRRLDRFRSFDPETGQLTCESGVGFDHLIAVFLPRGWFPYVTPGTKFVTVGGAVASDVHGKNHHLDGSFSRHVVSLDLMLADGRIVRCSRDENGELFRATCGGMGLTGLILEITFRLRPISSAFIRQKLVKTKNLEHTFERFEDNGAAAYSAAWIDCLAKGRKIGRSVLMVGEHADEGGLEQRPAKRHSVPFDLPGFVLNKHSISAFNALYYRKARPAETLVPLDSFFYPLDAVLNWNRIYGKKGFIQYQFVLPKETSFQGLTKVLDTIASVPIKPFLAVLKLLGPENDSPLSFPMEGYTLALDFKIEPRLFPLLEQLDRIVIESGGRLYLAKDARMNDGVFRDGYPRWRQFDSVRRSHGLRKKFSSLQSRRLDI